MRQYPSDIAFTPAVKDIQTAKGSRASYAKVERRGWQTHVTPDLTEFLTGLDMFYLGTANAEGQPYIQYRGGSPGFLKVLDDKTLGFADFGVKLRVKLHALPAEHLGKEHLGVETRTLGPSAFQVIGGPCQQPADGPDVLIRWAGIARGGRHETSPNCSRRS